MLHRTEGIVLHSSPYGEADLIVTSVTRDFGLIRLFAKSPRKVGSRFGSSLEPLTHARIAFFGKEQSRLPRLTQADILRPFQSLRERISLFLQISEAVELTLRVLPERTGGGKAFGLLLTTLRQIEEGGPGETYLLYYKIHLLRLAGFAPKLGRCGRCGQRAERFFLREGTVLCRRCEPEGLPHSPIEPRTERIYSYFLRARPSGIPRLKAPPETIKGLAELINAHINYTVVERLNSRSFPQLVEREAGKDAL